MYLQQHGGLVVIIFLCTRFESPLWQIQCGFYMLLASSAVAELPGDQGWPRPPLVTLWPPGWPPPYLTEGETWISVIFLLFSHECNIVRQLDNF